VFDYIIILLIIEKYTTVMSHLNIKKQSLALFLVTTK